MMQKVTKIVVDDEPAVEVDIRIWPDSTFILRFGPGLDVTFHADRVEDGVARCRVLEGRETLRKLREAAA